MLRYCLFLIILLGALTPAHALELKELIMSSEEDGRYLLEVELVSEERCMFGDLDALLLDLMNRGGRSGLQLSAEPLEPMTPTNSAFSGPHKDEAGRIQVLGSFSIRIPAYEQPTVLGIFLCSADLESQHQQPCRQKQLAPINDILKQHQVDKLTAIGSDGKLQPAPLLNLRPPPAVNKVYFARFLIAHGNVLSVPDSSMNEDSYEQLFTFLRSVGANVSDYDALQKTLSSYGTTLGSMPMKVEQSRLRITLPYYSTEKCLGRSVQ